MQPDVSNVCVQSEAALTCCSPLVSTAQLLGSFQESERASIAKAVRGQSLWIGIKKLLMLIEMSVQVRTRLFLFIC